MTLTLEFQGQILKRLYLRNGGGQLTWNEKDLGHPFMTMTLTKVTMVGWADVLDSGRGYFRRQGAINISSWKMNGNWPWFGPASCGWPCQHNLGQFVQENILGSFSDYVITCICIHPKLCEWVSLPLYMTYLLDMIALLPRQSAINTLNPS